MADSSTKNDKRRTSKGRVKIVLIRFTAQRCKRRGVWQKECLADRFPKKAEEMLARFYWNWTSPAFIASEYGNDGQGDVGAWFRDFKRHGLIEEKKVKASYTIPYNDRLIDLLEKSGQPKPQSQEVEVRRQKKSYRLNARGLLTLMLEKELRKANYVPEQDEEVEPTLRDWHDKHGEYSSKKHKIKKLIEVLAEYFSDDAVRKEFKESRDAEMKNGVILDVVTWIKRTIFNIWMLTFVLLRNEHNNWFSALPQDNKDTFNFLTSNLDKFKKKLEKTKIMSGANISILTFVLACKLTDLDSNLLLLRYYGDYNKFGAAWTDIRGCGAIIWG